MHANRALPGTGTCRVSVDQSRQSSVECWFTNRGSLPASCHEIKRLSCGLVAALLAIRSAMLFKRIRERHHGHQRWTTPMVHLILYYWIEISLLYRYRYFHTTPWTRASSRLSVSFFQTLNETHVYDSIASWSMAFASTSCAAASACALCIIASASWV